MAAKKMTEKILVNRAPVLTLWAAVVAERLGYGRDEALTLGRAVAGLDAQSKGRRLGLFHPHKERPGKARQKPAGEPFRVGLCGRAVPAVVTEAGVRALSRGKPINPEAVERYLEGRFGDRLPEVRKAMQKLAKAFKPKELAPEAYPLYEAFRPEIPEGTKGWGARGELDLDKITAPAEEE